MRIRNTWITLLSVFSRSVLRQPILALLLLIAPLLGLFLRFILPFLDVTIASVDLEPWRPLILGIFLGFSPYFYGFLAALVLLDERDKNLLPALTVTPVSKQQLLASKIVPASILALTGTPLSLLLSGFAPAGSYRLALGCGLLAMPLSALYALFIVGISANKVQALTCGKVLGVSLIAPLGLGLLPNPWRRLFLLFPGSWISILFIEADPGLWAAGALCISLILLIPLWKWSMRRYFS